MQNCGATLSGALVALVLAALVQSGQAAEKLASCCEVVSNQEITEPITGFMIQRASAHCVEAVIFQTEKGLFCSYLKAPWVRSKIVAFRKAKAQASRPPVVPSPTVSLLSIITSTASPPPPPPPSSSPSSSSYTSMMPRDEAEDDVE